MNKSKMDEIKNKLDNMSEDDFLEMLVKNGHTLKEEDINHRLNFIDLLSIGVVLALIIDKIL